MNYEKYITSSKWKRSSARKAELKSAGYRCRGCYAPADRGCALELHHRTYERLGNERPGDLTALCHDCHHALTSGLRARRYNGSPPTPADHVPATRDRAPLFDPSHSGGRS
jgi:5-methylcytosine-specific restriction endonuclease McrA